jgi:hypothetical protein
MLSRGNDLLLIKSGYITPLVMLLSIASWVAAPPNAFGAVTAAPSAPVDKPPTVQEIVSKLVEDNHYRETHLRQYSVIETYVVKNDKGRVLAETSVRMQYRVPGTKTFTTRSAEGSGLIRRLIFKRLMQQEVRRAAGRGRQASTIGPDNYAFDLVGEEHIDLYDCFVVRATPKRRDKYLFEGKIWINAEDFGIVKITGHPARKLSLWMKRVDFVRDYQKVDRFWLPSRDKAIAEIRFFGRKTLTIDYVDYNLTSGSEL